MSKYRDMATAFALICAGIWFFQDALSGALIDQENIRQSVISETIIQVGQKEPCIADINLSVWGSMNQLKIYRWVVSCEDATP